MKGDLPAAALRLMSCCRSTVHERQMQDYAERNSANNVRPVIVNGVLYESLTEAARRVGVGREAIRKRIYKGTASYA